MKNCQKKVKKINIETEVEKLVEEINNLKEQIKVQQQEINTLNDKLKAESDSSNLIKQMFRRLEPTPTKMTRRE